MKEYVLAGSGGRGYWMYASAIAERYGDVAHLAGIMDVNRKRAEYVKSLIPYEVPVYTDFDRMMEEVKPDCVIVTTVDRFHSIYVVKALDFGADVICEKPMTMDEESCNAILDAEERSGRRITVTFNCRYMPLFARMKELLAQGVVGEVLNVHFEWMLDTVHGADYFRRWHRKLENCGGLLVHKSTHHFDIVNWLIGQEPEEVFANGALRFYGSAGRKRGERCCTCPYAGECEYVYQDSRVPWVKAMYFDCESEDGYYRDRCVFAEEIDIYDTMSLAVKYCQGALMSYSLVAHAPYEGWKISISGTKGRMEANQFDTGTQAGDDCFHIRLFDRKGGTQTYDLKKETGSHGGGDERLLRMLFRGDLPDPLGQFAGSKDGSMSILIGIAANRSIREHRPVTIEELVSFDRWKERED